MYTRLTHNKTEFETCHHRNSGRILTDVESTPLVTVKVSNNVDNTNQISRAQTWSATNVGARFSFSWSSSLLPLFRARHRRDPPGLILTRASRHTGLFGGWHRRSCIGKDGTYNVSFAV
jgi:hypothetical protein